MSCPLLDRAFAYLAVSGKIHVEIGNPSRHVRVRQSVSQSVPLYRRQTPLCRLFPRATSLGSDALVDDGLNRYIIMMSLRQTGHRSAVIKRQIRQGRECPPWQYVLFHTLISIGWGVDVLCCSTVIMDMSAAAMGTAGRPSGSIRPPYPEAAARVRTTSTALGG